MKIAGYPFSELSWKTLSSSNATTTNGDERDYGHDDDESSIASHLARCCTMSVQCRPLPHFVRPPACPSIHPFNELQNSTTSSRFVDIAPHYHHNQQHHTVFAAAVPLNLMLWLSLSSPSSSSASAWVVHRRWIACCCLFSDSRSPLAAGRWILDSIKRSCLMMSTGRYARNANLEPRDYVIDRPSARCKFECSLDWFKHGRGTWLNLRGLFTASGHDMKGFCVSRELL